MLIIVTGTFITLPQSFLTELKGLFGVQPNIWDGAFLVAKIVKDFYALTIFPETLSHGCLTGL